MTSDSMPATSVMAVIRREPSFMRACWMTRSTAPATCSRMARTGRSTPAISTMVSRRDRLSRGVFAWTVVIEPSWPVFMAWSMSRAAPSRTLADDDAVGPHTQRVLDELADGDRAPALDVGGRDSRRRTWSWCSWSSAASSMVMMRSSSGMNEEMTLSRVVLPEPVPPEMMMLRRPLTQADQEVTDPRGERAEGDEVLVGERVGRRTFGWSAWRRRGRSGGMTALTREPSGRRASTSGLASSTRRPTRPTILSMVRRRWASLLKCVVDGVDLAGALDVDRVGPVDHDLGDLAVAQQGLEGAVAEDLVGDLLGDPGPVRERRAASPRSR